MILRTATRFDEENWFKTEIDKSVPSCEVCGELDGVPVCFTGDVEADLIIGGSLEWNQLAFDGNFSDASNWGTLSGATLLIENNEITMNISRNFGGTKSLFSDASIISGHKYLCMMTAKASNVRDDSVGFGLSDDSSHYQVRKVMSLGTSYETLAFIGTQTEGTLSSGGKFMIYDTKATASPTVLTVKNAQVFNLTQMFGETVADYIYSLETATAGAGVALFKALFSADYYEYNAGEEKTITLR